MNYEENGITIGQLFSVVKKSLKRALIYVLTSVIILAAVLITVQGFTGIKTYSSNVTFSKANEGTISSLNLAKTNVVNLALTDSELSLDLSDDVVKNLSVAGIIPDEDVQDFIPTSYEITLKTDKLDLTSGEYTTLLDNIVKHYVNIFSKNQLSSLNFNYNAENELSYSEYIQVSITMGDYIQTAIDDINSYLSANPNVKTFKETETNKTLEDVFVALSSINNRLETLNNTIVVENIQKSAGSIQSYLNLAKANATANVNKYNDQLVTAEATFKEYSARPSVQQDNNGITYITYDDTIYAELWESIKTASTKKAVAQSSLDKFTAYADVNTANSSKVCTDDQKTGVKNTLIALTNEAIDTFNTYKKIADAYNDNQYLTSTATTTLPAHATVENVISTKIIIIAIVAVALIAYVVAFAQTFSIMKKNGSLYETVKEPEAKAE